MRSGRENLDSERISRLEAIGFVWNPLDKQWEEMFAKLEEYSQKNGDCLVPRGYQKDPSLGIWVKTQRMRREVLDPARRERLDSIEFVWDPLDKKWEDMFAKLKEYRQLHGDCLVPREYKEDPSLGNWVYNMRRGRDNLDSERILRLESIGFVWDTVTINGSPCLPNLRNIIVRMEIVAFRKATKRTQHLDGGSQICARDVTTLILNEFPD